MVQKQSTIEPRLSLKPSCPWIEIVARRYSIEILDHRPLGDDDEGTHTRLQHCSAATINRLRIHESNARATE